MALQNGLTLKQFSFYFDATMSGVTFVVFVLASSSFRAQLSYKIG
jgi:hypothetical protein